MAADPMTPPDAPTPDATIHPDLAGLAVPIETLAPLPGNPRVGDVEAVMRSYAMFGQRKPIVARREGGGGIVLAGNHQLEAARRLGWPSIAVVWVDDDDLTAKAFALADNRTADLGSYDDEALAAMLAAIADSEELMAAASFSVIAAHSLGRVARLVELDPGYCDVICRRYQQHTGERPVLEATGEPHDFEAAT